MIFFNELGSFLYKRRKAFGYTQEMVAEIIGVSDRTLRNIEYNVTVPELQTVMKLWDVYELSPDVLFSFYSRDKIMSEMLDFYEIKRRTRAKAGN